MKKVTEFFLEGQSPTLSQSNFWKNYQLSVIPWQRHTETNSNIIKINIIAKTHRKIHKYLLKIPLGFCDQYFNT